MFEKKVDYVIFISKEVLFLIKSDFALPEGYKDVEKYDWNASNLREVIEGIFKKHEINTLGFLLSDDLVYIFSTKIQSHNQNKNIRPVLEQKVKEKVPEDVRELTWDFKSREISKDTHAYQIAAINNRIANILEGFISHPKVDIQFIEPFSYALARLTKGKSGFHAIVYSSDFSSCMIIANEGFVYYVQTFDPNLFESEFITFNDYGNHMYLMDKSNEVVVSSNLSSIKLVTGDNTDWKVQNTILNPLHIFEDPKLYKGKDAEVLNIDLTRDDEESIGGGFISKFIPSKMFGKENTEKFTSLFDKGEGSKTNKSKNDNKRLYLMIGFLAILVTSAIVLVIMKQTAKVSTVDKAPEVSNISNSIHDVRNGNDISESNNGDLISDDIENAVDSNEIEDENVEPQAEETEDINFAIFAVQIQNGTGSPGSASTAKSLLEEGGFVKFNLGNADNFDYEKTIVKVSGKVSDNVIETIQESLSEYDLEFSEDDLDDDDDYDIRIILGNSRNADD